MNLLLHYFATNFEIFQFFAIDSFQNDDNFIVVMLLMGALFFAIAIVIGIVLCLIFIALVISLLAEGLVPTSILVGLHQKSASQGFKIFFIAGSILCATIASVVFFYFANVILKWSANGTVILIAIICGAFSDWLLGLLLFATFKKIVAFLKTKYVSAKEKHLS